MWIFRNLTTELCDSTVIPDEDSGGLTKVIFCCSSVLFTHYASTLSKDVTDSSDTTWLIKYSLQHLKKHSVTFLIGVMELLNLYKNAACAFVM